MPAKFTRTARIGALACLPLLVLAGCSKNHGELVVDDTVGVTALRSPCPLVGIPEMTGDITLLAPGRLDSNAIDTVATITNLRHSCDNDLHQAKLTSRVDFDVLARRNDTARIAPARTAPPAQWSIAKRPRCLRPSAPN